MHGAPLGADDVAEVKKKFGFDPAQTFFVPEEARAVYLKCREKGKELEHAWNALFEKYAAQFPELVHSM